MEYSKKEIQHLLNRRKFKEGIDFELFHYHIGQEKKFISKMNKRLKDFEKIAKEIEKGEENE